MVAQQKNKMTSLRGSSVNNVVADELPTTVVRLLQTVLNVTASQQQNSNVGSSNPYDNNAFMMFLTVIVVLVVLCYIVCLWHMVRIWCCKRSASDQQAAHDLVISGRVFDLTTDQRRAVLEAIFSETSKVRQRNLILIRGLYLFVVVCFVCLMA